MQNVARPPRRPRKTYASPACGLRCRDCCTCRARPFIPRRISVVPAASQTRMPEDGIIIRATPTARGGVPPRSLLRRHSRARCRSARSRSTPFAAALSPETATALMPPASRSEQSQSGPGRDAVPSRRQSRLQRGDASDRPGSGRSRVGGQRPGCVRQAAQTPPPPWLETQRHASAAALLRSRSVGLPRHLWLPLWQPPACLLKAVVTVGILLKRS